MGAARFYHLTQSRLEDTLPMIARRSLAEGWRVLVRAPDAAVADDLDTRLWLGAEDEFFAHGLAGGAHDALQPVLLTAAEANPNGARCLIAVGGAAVTPADCAAMERTCILFDGTDAAALAAARLLWKSLTAAGTGAQYWSEEDGRWQMKAENVPA